MILFCSFDVHSKRNDVNVSGYRQLRCCQCFDDSVNAAGWFPGAGANTNYSSPAAYEAGMHYNVPAIPRNPINTHTGGHHHLRAAAAKICRSQSSKSETHLSLSSAYHTHAHHNWRFGSVCGIPIPLRHRQHTQWRKGTANTATRLSIITRIIHSNRHVLSAGSPRSRFMAP